MPEFTLQHGSAKARTVFGELDAFTRGYIEAAFFTDASSADDGDLSDATFSQIPADVLAIIVKDCASFQESYHYHLLDAIEWAERAKKPYTMDAAGRDLWFTRNGHGVGFWDRGLGVYGDKLTTAAKRFGETGLYRGDDGGVHLY